MDFETFFGNPGMFFLTVCISVVVILSIVTMFIIVKMYKVISIKQSAFMSSFPMTTSSTHTMSKWILFVYILMTLILTFGFVALFLTQSHVF